MLATISGVASGSPSVAASATVWDALAERILNTAVIRHPRGDFSKHLRSALVGVPADTQLRWVEVLRARLVRRSGGGCCGTCSSEDAVALDLGLHASIVCTVCTARLQTPSDLLTSTLLTTMQAAQLAGVPQGVGCASALTGAFRGLCEVSNRAYVLDRFGISDAIRGHNSSAGSSGLQRFVDLADNSGMPEVDIYVSAGTKVAGHVLSPADVIQEASNLLSAPGRSVAVTVHVLPFVQAKRLLHDRWIGFTWGGQGMVTWQLGNGLGQYNGGTSKQHHGLGRQADQTVIVVKGQLDPHVVLRARVT